MQGQESLALFCQCIAGWAATASFLPRFFFPTNAMRFYSLTTFWNSLSSSLLWCVQIIVEARNVRANLATQMEVSREIQNRAKH